MHKTTTTTTAHDSTIHLNNKVWLCTGLCMLFSACTVTKINPRSAQHQVKASKLIEEGKLPEAEAQLNLALEYNKRFPEAINSLGIIAYQRKAYAEAIKKFDEAIALDPDFAESYNNKGVTLLAAKHPADAINAFSKALSIDPGYWDARYNLALTYFDIDDFSAAYQQSLKLLAVKPDDLLTQSLFACLGLFSLNVSNNAYQRASELAQSLSNAPINDPHTKRCIGVTRWKQATDAERRGETGKQAIRLLDEAVKNRPEDVAILADFGEVLLSVENKATEAIPFLRGSINGNRYVPRAHYNLGQALLSVGDIQGASEAFRSFVDNTGDIKNPAIEQLRQLARTQLASLRSK